MKDRGQQNLTHQQLVRLMGSQVLVTKTLLRCSDDGRTFSWKELSEEPRVGWLIGIRWVQNGKVEPGGDDGDGIYIPSVFWITSTVRAVLVAWWPTMKGILVPVSGISTDLRGMTPKHPNAKDSQIMKDMFRDHPELFPRDSKGRFT